MAAAGFHGQAGAPLLARVDPARGRAALCSLRMVIACAAAHRAGFRSRLGGMGPICPRCRDMVNRYYKMLLEQQ